MECGKHMPKQYHVHAPSGLFCLHFLVSKTVRTRCQFSSTFLRTNFSYEHRFSSFYYVHTTRKSCRNDVCTKNLYVKHWWNWHQVEIPKIFSFFHYRTWKVEAICFYLRQVGTGSKTNAPRITQSYCHAKPSTMNCYRKTNCYVFSNNLFRKTRYGMIKSK